MAATAADKTLVRNVVNMHRFRTISLPCFLSSLRSPNCRTQNAARSVRLLQGFSQLQLEERHRQVADAAMTEGARARVEDRGQSRILRDGFQTALLIARDTKCALGPAENAIGLAGSLPQK